MVEFAFRLTFPFFRKKIHLNTHERSVITNIHVKILEVLLKLVLHITEDFITHRPWSCSLRHRSQERRFLRPKVHIIARFWDIIIYFILSFLTAVDPMVMWLTSTPKVALLNFGRDNSLTNLLHCFLHFSRENTRIHSDNCYLFTGRLWKFCRPINWLTG
jgi:hypothetical protein